MSIREEDSFMPIIQRIIKMVYVYDIKPDKVISNEETLQSINNLIDYIDKYVDRKCEDAVIEWKKMFIRGNK